MQKLLDFQSFPDYSIEEALQDFEELLITKEPEEKPSKKEQDFFNEFRGSVLDEQMGRFTLGNNIFRMNLGPEEDDQEEQEEFGEPKYTFFALDNFTLKQRNTNLKQEKNIDSCLREFLQAQKISQKNPLDPRSFTSLDKKQISLKTSKSEKNILNVKVSSDKAIDRIPLLK